MLSSILLLIHPGLGSEDQNMTVRDFDPSSAIPDQSIRKIQSQLYQGPKVQEKRKLVSL